MENLGTAKGYIDLDLGKMTSSIRSAVGELEKIEQVSKRTDSEIALLQSTSTKTGTAFQQAADRAKSLASQLDAAKSKVQVYEKEIGTLKTQLEESAKTHDTLAKAITSARQKYEAAQKTVAALDAAYKESKANLEAVQQIYDKNSDAVQKAKEETASYAEQLKTARQTSADYAREVNDLENQQRKLDAEIATAQDQLDKFGTECNNAKADVNTLAIELANTQSVAQQFGDWMDDAGTKLQNLGDKVSNVGGRLSTGVTAPLTALGTAAVKMAEDVEYSEAQIATIVDTATTSLDQLHDSARSISDDTGLALTDINDAMYEYLQAIDDPKNAALAAELSVKAAKAGLTEAATAMDGMTTIMNSYGMEGSQAMQDIVDKMMETQNVGKTTFGELSQYIGQVAPIAVQAGIPLDDLLGSIAALTSNGIQTSSAMTGLKAALSNIINPTEEASEAAAALGINWDAATLQEKGLSGMLDELKVKIGEAEPAYAKLSDEMLANNAAAMNLEMQNEDLLAQMEKIAEDQGKSSDAYKALKEQYEENEDAIKSYSDANEGLAEQMTFLASAADSPLSAYTALFGSIEGLNSMMVLASEDGGAKWKEFTADIANSSGTLEEAYSKISNTNLEKFRTSITRLKNTAVDAGTQIMPVVTEIVGDVTDLVSKFSELDEEQQELIIKIAAVAAAAGPVLKVGGTAISTIGSITSGVGNLIKSAAQVTSVGTDVATAAGSATAALGTGGLTGVLQNLASPTGWAIVGATAIAGIGLACKAAYDQAIENNLAEHFGTVQLSAEEAEDAARRITETPWRATLEVHSTAVEDLENIRDSIETTVESMNKTQWMIETGIELTDEEKEAYRNDVESFVSQMQSYVEQQQYTSTIAIKTIFGDEGETLDFSNDVYGGLNAELTKLGEELSDLVNTAFENNMLDDESTRELITQKEREIQDVLDEIAQARYDVEMQKIAASVPDGTLTAESFQAVQKSLTEQMEQAKSDIENAEVDALVPYRVELGRGEISQEEYNAKVQETLLEAAERMGEVDLQGINYEISTITGTYSEANNEAAQAYTEDLKTTFQENLNRLGSDLTYTDFFNLMEAQLGAGYSELSRTEQAAIRELLDQMQPQKEELEALAAQYTEAGQQIPASIAEGIASIERLEAMTGSVDAAYSLLADQVATSPELQEAINQAYATGEVLPTQLVTALQNKYPDVYNSTIGLFSQMTAGEQMSHETLVQSFAALGIEIPDSIISALSSKTGEVQSQTMQMLQSLQTGYALTYPQLTDLFTNLGITLPDALISELTLKAPEVQAQAVSLLSQIQAADEEKRPELIEQLQACGVDIDNSIINGMISSQDDVNAQADATVDGIRARVDGADAGTVQINTNDPEQEAQSWWQRFTSWLSGLSTGVKVNTMSTILNGYSDGGIVDTEQIAAVAEGDNPEMIIPLSAEKRARALELYAEAGEILNVNAYNMSAGGSGTSELAAAIASRLETVLRSAPISQTVEVYMEDGDVLMDSERVGRKVAPTVSRIQAKRG